MKIKDVQILREIFQKLDGFAKVSQLVVRNVYEDDTLGPEYTCDMVWRNGHDAVCIIAYGRMNDEWQVVLRKQARPIVKFRDGLSLHASLPGGCIEVGQSVKECVVKEAFEELGLKINLDLPKQLGLPLYSSVGWLSEKIYFYTVYLEPEQLSKIIGEAEVENTSGELMESGATIQVVPLSQALAYAQCEMFEVAIHRLKQELLKWQ